MKTHQSIFVSGCVDGHHFLQSEVPFQIRVDEWCYKSTTCCINMNDSVNVLLDQKVIDGLRILIFASVCAT
jgi:hypothetical protein